jgi:23S rRNA pseudouridine2605 synthase
MRINQYIAKTCGISRRKADEKIKSKEVKVNGVLAEFVEVKPTDIVEYLDKGRWIKINNIENSDNQSDIVLLVYKPVKVITSHDDPEKRTTVFDLLPKEYGHFKTAGRLDYMSEGLLVLTSNGHLILTLTHPKFKTKKTYLVGIDKPLSPLQISKAASGEMIIEDYKLNAVIIKKVEDYKKFDFLKLERSYYWYTFELSEGRNREIRKVIDDFGLKVRRLIRVKHGEFVLTKEIFENGYLETTLVDQS